MRFATTASVRAAPERVWAVYTDVERWPEWTASVTSVERLDPGPLRVGSRVRVRQPKLPVTVWTVVDLVDGVEWTWEARGPGYRTTARHAVEADGDHARAVIELEQSGPLGVLVGKVTAGLTDRYLALEAEGLKARAESA